MHGVLLQIFNLNRQKGAKPHMKRELRDLNATLFQPSEMLRLKMETGRRRGQTSRARGPMSLISGLILRGGMPLAASLLDIRRKWQFSELSKITFADILIESYK